MAIAYNRKGNYEIFGLFFILFSLWEQLKMLRVFSRQWIDGETIPIIKVFDLPSNE